MEPQAPCTVVLSSAEWQTLYCTIHRTKRAPKTPPDLQTAVLWIARLGGFPARQSDGAPGITLPWQGYRRLQDLTATWEVFNGHKLTLWVMVSARGGARSSSWGRASGPGGGGIAAGDFRQGRRRPEAHMGWGKQATLLWRSGAGRDPARGSIPGGCWPFGPHAGFSVRFGARMVKLLSPPRNAGAWKI